MLQIAVCDARAEDRDVISGLLKHYFKQYPYEYCITEYSSGETLTAVSYTHLDVYKRQDYAAGRL